MLGVFDPANLLTLPIWTAYAAVTGTVAMGLWVLAHECGHGASKNKALQDAVGYIIHSVMLVPYYSWQRSHAVHHQYTNNVELGETHVPETMVTKDEGSFARRDSFIKLFGETNGIKAWGGLQGFLHLIVGWPAYLLIGATGGTGRGMTNHYYPNPLSTQIFQTRNSSQETGRRRSTRATLELLLLLDLCSRAACNGIPQVMALYGGPLDEHSFVKGALHTIDRPYNKLDPWGIIDFLHHQIGTTHVAHHFDSSIPHYKAQAATDAIKENFPEFYLYDPTPIPEALWRVCKGCTAAEKRGDEWVWNNEGYEKFL
ncbi:fatty acid desaturase [Fragilaria crotonensis]|nr:fatty acid desaturase [Fragilaria crotonensis]